MEKLLKIHPDALYDAEYVDSILETDAFKPPELRVKGEYRYEKGVRVLTASGHGILIENCFENTLRLRITQPGRCVDQTVTERLGLIRTDWDAAAFDYKLEDGVIRFSNARLTLVFDLNTNEFSFRTAAGQTLVQTKNGGARFSEAAADYSGMRSYTEFARIGDERYSGFGARIYKVDRTGESADIFAEKGGARVGDYGGFPIPYFISSAGYGLFFNNPWPHVYFDMAKTDEKEWFLHAPGGDYDLFVFCGNTSEITKSYARIVGTNQFPKKWLMGYWCSSLSFERAQGAIDDTTRMRREGFSRRRSFFVGQASGLVEPVAGVLGAWLVVYIESVLPYALAFAAGAMILVAVHELIPECQQNRGDSSYTATMGIVSGFALMMLLDVMLG